MQNDSGLAAALSDDRCLRRGGNCQAANLAEGFLVPNMGGQEGDQTTFIGGFPIRTYPGPIRGRWGL